jgi:hypothetical protein
MFYFCSHEMRAELLAFYDGPVPDDLARAAACGGLARLAALEAGRASRVLDGDCRLLAARRRHADRDRRDHDSERELRRLRAAGMAHLQRAQAANGAAPLLAPEPAE